MNISRHWIRASSNVRWFQGGTRSTSIGVVTSAEYNLNQCGVLRGSSSAVIFSLTFRNSTDQPRQRVEDRGYNPRHRHGDDPGDDNVLGDVLAHCGYPAGGTNADDRAGDRMRRRNGDAEACREKKRDRAPRFSAKALHRGHFGNFRAHGVDDPPAAEKGAEPHGHLTAQHDPKGDVKFAAELAVRKE